MRKLLVLLCFLIFVPFGAFAEVYSGVCGKRTVNEGKDVVWSCDTETGVLTISGSGKMDSYSNADIRRGINPPWEGTAPYYEDSCVPFIRHVIVEEGVTALGRFSFINLIHLSTISLPEGLESVSYESFGGCITSVTIPSTVKSLDFRAFERCDFIESITLLSSIPIGIDGITDKNFYYQNQIVLKVPDVEAYKNSDWAKYFRRIESIPENGEEMQKVYSGECLGYIAGMPKPTGISWSLDIESGVLTLSGSGIIPDYSTGTGSSLAPWYKYHMYITSVIMDSNVKGIGSNTFRSCAFLKSIVIPEGVTYIGSEAFSGCTALSSAIIPESVTSIGFSAFSRCTALSSIVIPEGITDIAIRMFEDCKALSSVVIPDSVTSIGENAFWGCSSLTNISVPKGVTRIESGVFAYCSSLSSIELPYNLDYIAADAFEGCESLPAENNIIYVGRVAIGVTDKTLSEYTLPENTEVIGAGLFSSCTSLSSVYIPDAVRVIGPNAFSGCTSLSSIHIPDGVAAVGYSAFADCTSLNSVVLPNSVTSIGSSALGIVFHYLLFIFQKVW